MGRTKPSGRRPPRGGQAAPGGSYPGNIRIIGGHWRGRRLPVLAAEGLRPTPDRVRETLFNWLAAFTPGASCLDLFSGTGALCLEALSRGAARVVMVERSAEAVRQLRANVLRLATQDAEVIQLDALEYLARPAPPFDIVFLDPPFAVAADMIRECSARLARGWLKSGALVYIEAPRTLNTLPLPPDWELIKSGTAGQVAYSLVRIRSAHPVPASGEGASVR